MKGTGGPNEYNSYIWYYVEDSYDYETLHFEIPTSDFFAYLKPPRSYYSAVGADLCATVCFSVKMGSNLNNNLAEYQYIQILTDNTTDFDGKDGDGGVSTPVKSVYKACFDYDITGGQSLDEFLWYLPHRYDDKNLAANTQNGHTIEFENEKNHLFAQKFRNASFRVSDAGALRLPVTTETIVVRPDAAGKNINDFEIRKVCARLALEDAVAPGMLSNGIKADPGPHCRGNRVTVSVPFSEAVKVTGTPIMATNWGDLSYTHGDGTNVLTFSGTISNTAATGTALRINGIAGTIKDLAGNEFYGSSLNLPVSGVTVGESWSYSIGCDLAGGALPAGYANPVSYTYEDDLTVVQYQPSRAGYTFAGWIGTGLTEPTMQVVIPRGSHGDRYYTAVWTPIDYAITYNLAGGAMPDGASNPASYNADSAAITLTNPVRTGYSFAGWTGTGLSGPTVNVTIPTGSTGDRSYTAAWTPEVYTITYDLAGGSLPAGTSNPASYTVESAAITLTNPVRTGWIFAGWSGTGLSELTLEVTIPAGSTGNRSYNAVWGDEHYTVSFDANGHAGAMDPVTLNPGSYSLPENGFGDADGWRFLGWTVGSDTTLRQPGYVITVSEDVTVTAQWEVRIKFNKGVETGAAGDMDPVWVTKGDSYTLPECGFTSATGGVFKGWKLSGFSSVLSPGATVPVMWPMTCTARWKSGWTALKEEIAAAPTDGTPYTITLSSDVTPNSDDESSDVRLKVLSGQNIILDLNGHTLDRGLSSGKSNGYHFLIVGGALTITGSGAVTGGYPNTGTNASEGSVATLNGGGSLTLAGGTLTGNSGGRAVITVASGCSFTMTGGTIRDNQSNSLMVYVAGGSFNLSGGELVGSSSGYEGDGVIVSGAGSVTLNGGAIRNTDTGVYLIGSSPTLSVSGAPAFSGNNSADLSLATGSVVTVSGPLEPGVRISVETYLAPTAANPIVITSGLPGNGTPGNFTSARANCTVGQNAAGEAILGRSATVSFAANGGGGSMADAAASQGGLYVLPACGFAPPAGMEFAGWDLDGTAYQPGDTVPISGDITLTALWREAEIQFVDVPDDAWYYDAVLWACRYEPQPITAGTSATTFSPNQTCTRAQIVTFLWRAAGSPEPACSAGDLTVSPFPDVQDPNAYYYKAVLWAYENGITAGVGGSGFGVNQSCTRAQVVTFLWRFAGSPEPESSVSPFEDVQDAGAWYYKAVLWAAENQITAGTGPGVFSPSRSCTRAQVVTFLYKCCAESAPET